MLRRVCFVLASAVLLVLTTSRARPEGPVGGGYVARLLLSSGKKEPPATPPVPASAVVPGAVPAGVPFDKGAGPLLSRRCQPCHFPGGKMYDRLPFDDPAAVRRLGEKLFTRIKDEKERDVLRGFFAPPR